MIQRFDQLSETELRKILLEQQAILDNASVGILFSRDRRVATCNLRCAELFGYSLTELVGLPADRLFSSHADYNRLGHTAGPALAAGSGFHGEIQFSRRDGAPFWARVSAKAIDPERPHDGTIWIVADISEERAVREALSQTTHEQELIFNNAAVGMMFARNRIVRRCNRKFEQIFGYPSGELVGQSVLLLHPTVRDYDEFGSLAYGALQRGETHIGEQRARRKDGSIFWVRSTGCKTDALGSPLDVIWIFEDVSERHQVEEALAQAHSELEQRVVERTSQLVATNEQLQAEIFERMQAEQRIWHIAHHDALTGLPNRSLLLDRLNQALTQAGRSDHRLAVMFLDLDRFKIVNDTLGHHIGDQLLKHVAMRLREAVRAVDTVSRLGGDEFVVVLHEIQAPDDASRVAEKILEAMVPVVLVEGNQLHATPSIGISIYPDDGDEAYALMKNADTAMYHAKADGRNTFRFFTAKMNEETRRFFGFEQRLRNALLQHQFLLHFQPLIDHTRMVVCGVEALVRWQDPELGLTMPGDFIAVAEETGLILQLGEGVLREALRQNAVWQAQGFPALPVSVNLSPRQFYHKGLVDMVRAILNESGQPPELLELEVTESALMHDANESLGKLRQLADLGIQLAIDDFGTASTSLAYLKRFPVHRLKIDQSFVRDVAHDRDDAAVVSAVMALTGALGLETLAEGVETQEQLAFLLGFGCRQFQGYLFAHPLPPEQANAIFRPSGLT
ncbi:MAG: EAL domain-containing protein [Sterolibacterium sp.]